MASHAPKATAKRVADLSFMEVLPPGTRLSFRGGADAIAAASKVLGLELPTTACRASVSGERAALWLGPDEYLLFAPEADGTALISALATGLSGIAHSVVDVSHRQSGLRIKGTHAAWILESACPLDLDESQFPVGMCTRTIYEKCEITLWRKATHDFHIEVWRSYTEYVTSLLAEVALELPA